jgi:hypothetical protein
MSVRILIAALALSGALAIAETKSQPGVEAQMIVTSADHMNHRPPALQADDLRITDATITNLIPFEGGRDLELFILIDDAANYDFGAKLQELRRFVTSQPAPVSIGIAFIREGTLDVVEQPTRDHQRAARALRAPSGSIAANPYCALSGLIDGWKNKSLRREIVLVSTGIDDTSTGAVCVNAETTIRDAERAGVVVYALYNPVTDYASEKWSKVDSGIVDLAHVSYETGGEAYFTGHTPTATLEPFLTDIAEHLAHQYLVKFRLASVPESGFQTIHVSSGNVDQELMKPERIWVPGPTAVSTN